MQDEIRLYCSGTATPASKLVPYAIGMVNRLREVDSFGSKQASGENWWIDVKVNNGHATIRIFEDGEVTDEVCPGYMSGMTQFGVAIRKNDPTTGANLTGLWAFQPSTAYRIANKLASGWQIGKNGRSGVPNSVSPPYFDANLGTEIPPSWIAEGWSQASMLKPGLYSGVMRNVVQVLLGSNEQVLYDFHFAKTHGIFVVGSGKTRADWLIEISAQNGVLAMPLPICKGSVPKQSTLGYVPMGGTFPAGPALDEAIKSGMVRRLMTPDDLRPAYSKSAFSPVFGWAFSYSGREASIVVSGGGDKYTVTTLYTVTFGVDNKGTPVTAALVAGESSSVISSSYSMVTGYAEWAFKVPYDVGGASYPVDFGPSEGTYEAASCNAPLHVWYRPSGERVIVRFRNGPVVARRPSDESPRPPNYPKLNSTLDNEYIEYPPPESITGSYTEQAAQAAYVSPMAGSPGSNQVSPQRYTYKAQLSSGATVRYDPRDYHYGDTYQEKLLRTWETTQTGYVLTVNTAIVIPAFEREAALQITVNTKYVAGESRGFSTYGAEGYGCQYILSGYSISLPVRPDGMPTSGTFNARYMYTNNGDGYDFGTSLSTPISNGYGLPGGGASGLILKGTFGGSFGGPFGENIIPVSFNPPGDFAEASDGNAYSAFEPFSDVVVLTGRFTRRVSKVAYTNDGTFTLTIDPGEEFTDSTLCPPLGSWFHNSAMFYPLIQSWDAKLRYSPPDFSGAGQTDYSKCVFGSYLAPSENKPLLINFVGDA